MLAPGARLVGDAGGKARTPLRVITSADRFMAGAARRETPGVRFEFLELNGAVAVFVTSEGRAHTVLVADIANPGKVGHLAP